MISSEEPEVEMSMWSLFKDLKPTSMNPGVKARCIRCYNVKSPKDPKNIITRECIFHDSEVPTQKI